MIYITEFDLIVHEFSRDLETIRIYPLGDVHVGSENFNEKLFDKWLEMVKNDHQGYVVIVGDLLDNGLKNSKTNSYDATMSPREQKNWIRDRLKPIKGKILGAVAGNHELRSRVLTDDCPLYDILAMLELEHLYRENFGFLKLSLGEKRSDRQWTYTMALAHGKSRNKTEKFAYAIDGMDIFVTGHLHSASATFPSKIVIDPRNNVVKMQGFLHITVPSFQDYAGYAIRDMYMPTDNNKVPVITLSGIEKEVTLKWM